MRKSLCAAAAAALGLAACVPPVSPSQRLAESAHDMNTAARFGRMDVALELVASTERGAFTRRHVSWGRELRVVDVELTSMRLTSNDEANVLVSVTWQRSDEADVRITHLEQQWRDDKGGWRLLSEARSSGDTGLLGERTKKALGDALAAEEPARAPRASFQTRVIRAAP